VRFLTVTGSFFYGTLDANILKRIQNRCFDGNGGFELKVKAAASPYRKKQIAEGVASALFFTSCSSSGGLF